MPDLPTATPTPSEQVGRAYAGMLLGGEPAKDLML
jgi:hypothetical protein